MQACTQYTLTLQHTNSSTINNSCSNNRFDLFVLRGGACRGRRRLSLSFFSPWLSCPILSCAPLVR